MVVFENSMNHVCGWTTDPNSWAQFWCVLGRRSYTPFLFATWRIHQFLGIHKGKQQLFFNCFIWLFSFLYSLTVSIWKWYVSPCSFAQVLVVRPLPGCHDREYEGGADERCSRSWRDHVLPDMFVVGDACGFLQVQKDTKDTVDHLLVTLNFVISLRTCFSGTVSSFDRSFNSFKIANRIGSCPTWPHGHMADNSWWRSWKTHKQSQIDFESSWCYP